MILDDDDDGDAKHRWNSKRTAILSYCHTVLLFFTSVFCCKLILWQHPFKHNARFFFLLLNCFMRHVFYRITDGRRSGTAACLAKGFCFVSVRNWSVMNQTDGKERRPMLHVDVSSERWWATCEPGLHDIEENALQYNRFQIHYNIFQNLKRI